jgi:hypothetical protein
MESRRPGPQSDDVDLGQLFSKLGTFFSDTWMNFIRFLATIRRTPVKNKWSFLAIIVASVALGFILNQYVRKNYYESTMILSSTYLNKRLAENTIEKLDILAGEENKSQLAKVLGLHDSLADNIVGFEVQPFVAENDVIELEVLKEQLRGAQTNANNQEVITQVIERIEIENRHAFEITVRTLNPSVIPDLQHAIVGHFRNNPYIRKRIEINRENLLGRKEKLTRDIEKLDSLKSVIYANYRNMADQSRQGSNNVILSDKAVTDPVDIYNQDLLIYNELQDVDRDLFLQKDFEIVDGFTEFSEPASASSVTVILYSLLIGVVVAYLDVAIRTFNSYLANFQ